MLSAIWSPNGNLIASGFPDNGIVIWNPNTGERVNPVFGGTTFAWSPDSTQLVTGSFYNNTLHIQDVIAGSEVMSLTGASDVTNSVAWSPDGSRIASSSADHKIHIWNATNGQLLSTLNIPNTIDVQWSPDGQQIATAGFDADSNNGWISIWDANAGIELSRFSENERIYSVSWHPDGNQLVYVASGTVKIVPAPQLQTPAPSATIQSEAQTLRDLLSYPTCQRTCFMGIEPGVTTQTEVQKVFSDQNISYTVFAGIQDDREENGIYYGTGKRNIPFLSQHGGILESDVLFKDGIAGSIHLLMDIPISVILKAYGQPAIFTVDDGDYWLIYPAERLAFQVRDFISTENANLVFIMTDDVLLEAFINTPDLPVQDCPASTELCLIQTATPTP
jgi:WD40 repeat protein